MDGRNMIGFNYSALANDILSSYSPAMRRALDGAFHIATQEEIDRAMDLATAAFAQYRLTSGVAKARFLNTIAKEILALGDQLIQRAIKESGLPKDRIVRERDRTIDQLHAFANLVEEGSWVEAIIDQADPKRSPLPKPDIRRMLIPLGPAVVFTASNFPLAFSTAGGDTASALAAGCPVIVKAHESHLGTNALVSMAIQKAAEKTGMPDGVFSSLNGTGPDLGQALTKHPKTKVIAFTGSFPAGKAIFDTANKRTEPIPVFAEMGSINPVLLLDNALQKRGESIAQQYAQSITQGGGQFCTNPGLLIGRAGKSLQKFIKLLSTNIEVIPPATMLSEGIYQNFEKAKNKLLSVSGVQLVQLKEKTTGATKPMQAQAVVATVSGAVFLENSILQEEVFGPFTLIVCCASDTEIKQVVDTLQGQLTATLIGEKEELIKHQDILASLQNKVGRIIFNSVPTGVEICPAMQHGGPYPATTNSRSTSIGSAAIKRFTRPLAFQNWETDLLPDELKSENPLGIWRIVDGQYGKK